MTKNSICAIGLMSGTSLDGVDLVYVVFEKNAIISHKMIHAKTYAYSSIWKDKLKKAYYLSLDELNTFDNQFGIFLGDLINRFVSEYDIKKIDFIASHGHTIFHKPDEGHTLQIGNGKHIAEVTNCKVVYDFRTQDIEFGGQGAPLVPIGDKLLFSKYRYCLNLGGFANISYDIEGKRIAFDICPVNIVLNHYSRKNGLEFDDSGEIASSGKLNQTLLENLNALYFYSMIAPKSLGFEFVQEYIFPLIDEYEKDIPTILRTFVEHIALQISKVVVSSGTLFITGGGAYNDYLINRIKKLVSNKVIIPESELIEYKEALIFALLGLLRIDNQINCLSSVTGAKKDHSSGKICIP